MDSPIQGVSLKEYVERIFAEHEKARRSEGENARRSLELAAHNLTEKLAEMNEFRLQLERERGLYLQRRDLDPHVETLRKMEERNANIEGRLWALGVATTIMTVILSAVFSAITTILIRRLG